MFNAILITSTTIQDKIDAVQGDSHLLVTISLVTILAIGLPALTIFLRHKIWGKDTSFATAILSVMALTVVFGVSSGLYLNSKNEEFREAVKINVLENIDLQDETISLNDDIQRVTVLGMTDNGYVEFDMKYNEEHDLMMPIHNETQQVEIPVKEGSQLEEVTK